MSDREQPSRFSQFLAEMRRRHVVRFALGYAAAAFVVLQLAEIVFPAFGISEGGLRLLVVVTGLGFPPSLVLAWMFDLTSEGVQRTGAVENPILSRLAVGGLLIVTIALTGGLGVYLARQGVFESTVETAPLRPAVELAQYDPEAPIRSIAVLPLDDYSEAGDQAYFTASMHEELIAKLSALEAIRVVSRTSVAQFAGTTLTMPEIGQLIDADVVVEGSVARSASRTRVTLQIIHAPSDTHIETLQWDREDVEDILAFQTEIARDLVAAISSQYDETVFTQVASNVSPEAQDLYIKGRYEYGQGTEEGYRAAAEHFESALEADPDFAAAMAGIAGARFLIELEGDETLSLDQLSDAHEVALRALEMDSASMEVREVVSLIERAMPDLGMEPAIPAPATAPTVHVFTMNDGADSIVFDMPGLDSAWVTATTSLGSRIEETVRRWTTVREERPAEARIFEARQSMYAGRYRDAVRALSQIVEKDPGADLAWDLLVRSQVSAGSLGAARESVREWSAAESDRSPSAGEVTVLETLMQADGADGYWTWRLDRLEDLRARGVPVPSIEIASAHAALGHSDQAIEHLVDAISHGDPGALAIRADPMWDELRTDPRVREIARQARRVLSLPRTPPSGR